MNSFKEKLSDEQNRRNEIMTTITAFYNGERTEEIKQQILEIDEDLIADHRMFYSLLRMAKEYIKTGKVEDKETFAEYMKGESVDVFLDDEVERKWRKDPSEWEKEEKENDER